MKTVKNTRAEGYIDVAVAVLVLSFLLVLLVSVFGAVSQKQDLKYMCSELIETATQTGQIGDAVNERYETLCRETGLHPTVSFAADYFDVGNGTVQFGDVISCTLTQQMVLPGFGGVSLPFTVTVTQSGLSQVYWK